MTPVEGLGPPINSVVGVLAHINETPNAVPQCPWHRHTPKVWESDFQ